VKLTELNKYIESVVRALYSRLSAIAVWQASLIIGLCGLAFFSSGLTSPFQGDDLLQIVHNPYVHSIKNLPTFFNHSTFYGLNSTGTLTGSYYRPLMTTVFSLLYSIFGLHPFYFHLFQLLVSTASAVLLYLVLRYSFKPPLALFLSLVFLIHPLDSNVVYMIPCMQDVLFFFFGILGLYILIRFTSIKSLGLVAVCLLLSILAKETAIVFIGVALLFTLWWDRKRLLAFIGILIAPVALYLVLRSHAIGIIGSNPNEAPILRLDLIGRLMTIPSIIQFYITKMIFPWKLANAYFWVYPKFSISHVLVPLFVDTAVLAGCAFVGYRIRKIGSKAMFYTYLFFSIWAILGLLTTLQLIPVDMTASEAWFYFPFAGVLGMIGTYLSVFPLRLSLEKLMLIAIVLLGLYGVRTFIRGFDYNNPEGLAYKNVANSKEDYIALDLVATYKIGAGNYNQAEPYLKRSIAIYPTVVNYNLLGTLLLQEDEFDPARKAFLSGLKYGTENSLYDGLGKISLVSGYYESNLSVFNAGLKLYPRDANLWLYLALLEDENGYNPEAIRAIKSAAKYGQVSPVIYYDILSNTSFKVAISNTQSVTF
jgi:hypothetical protein